jgi:hypothetical protein
LKPNRKRKPGFYWVRFEGEIVVAEYTEGRGCSDERPHWHVPGSAECFKNREICELLSERLAQP